MHNAQLNQNAAEAAEHFLTALADIAEATAQVAEAVKLLDPKASKVAQTIAQIAEVIEKAINKVIQILNSIMQKYSFNTDLQFTPQMIEISEGTGLEAAACFARATIALTHAVDEVAKGVEILDPNAIAVVACIDTADAIVRTLADTILDLINILEKEHKKELKLDLKDSAKYFTPAYRHTNTQQNSTPTFLPEKTCQKLKQD